MADNPLIDTPDRNQRIRERAYHLWKSEGCPSGRDLEYWERARELTALEDSTGSGLLPNPAARPASVSGLPEGVEEAEIQQNYGEFPDRFADQGEWQPTPAAAHSKKERRQARAKAAVSRPPKRAGST